MTAPALNEGWCVYVLKCGDCSLYIGSTNNLERRLTQHANGTGSKYVRARKPFEVVKVISCQSGREAHQLEYRLKRLKRKKKIEVLSLGDDMAPAPGLKEEPTT
jgi:predicted GIY-YIG superfamily endonuclease